MISGRQYQCTRCGFIVPADPAGIGIMQAHLAEHDRECKGFVWTGQDFSGCERCGKDISEHEGLEWLNPGSSPFDKDRHIIIPFDDARRRIPLFAYYVTPTGVPDDYAGPYRYDKEIHHG